MPDLSPAEFSKKYIAVMSKVFKAGFRHQDDELIRGKISIPQFFSLYFIYNAGAQKMSSIAREMSVSQPAMSGLITRLYKLGLVKRLPDPEDRRIIRIDLTQKGKESIQKILQERQRFIREIFGKITAEEREEFLRILSKIQDLYTGKK